MKGPTMIHVCGMCVCRKYIHDNTSWKEREKERKTPEANEKMK